MIQNPQQKHSFEQPEVADKQAEVEKLRQEIADMRKQLAEKKTEIKQEAVIEAPTEGKIDVEATEGAVAPNVPHQTAITPATPPDIDNQVKNLCELAFQKGVDEAIKAARELNNPYILDELHDILVDELYEKLLGENRIEKE